MQAIDRRGLFRNILVAVAATAAGAVFGADAGEAMPLDAHLAAPSRFGSAPMRLNCDLLT